MHVAQSVRDLREHGQNPPLRQLKLQILQVLSQRAAIGVLHDDDQVAIVLEAVVVGAGSGWVGAPFAF